MNIQLIALDLDGTTLAGDHLTLPKRNLIAIQAAMAGGIHVVVSTGRMRYRLPEQIESLSATRYAVTSNGAAVWDLLENKKLFEAPLSTTLSLEIVDQLLPLGACLELYHNGSCYTRRADDALWYTFPFLSARRKMMQRNRFLVEDLRAFILEDNKKIEKINIPYIPLEIEPQISDTLSRLRDVKITSSIAQNAEINAVGVNKAKGLQYLCNYLNIDAQQVLAVGDNENDLEMLQFAGYSAVPCNGLEACKQLAAYITCDNTSGAVGQAIEHFCSHLFV